MLGITRNTTAKHTVSDQTLQLQIGCTVQWTVVIGSLLYVSYLAYRAYQLMFGRIVITYRMLDRDIAHRITSGRTKKDVANMARKLRQRGDVPPVYPNTWYEVMRSEERLVNVRRYHTLPKCLTLPRSRCGLPWRSMASSSCGMMLKVGTPLTLWTSFQISRRGSGHTVDILHIM